MPRVHAAGGANPNEAPIQQPEHEKAYKEANRGKGKVSVVNEAPNPAEEMRTAFEDTIQTSPSADILIKAWADILQKELARRKLHFEVEKVSFIATIAEDRKGRKSKRRVKLQYCGKADLHNSSNNWSIEFV